MAGHPSLLFSGSHTTIFQVRGQPLPTLEFLSSLSSKPTLKVPFPQWLRHLHFQPKEQFSCWTIMKIQLLGKKHCKAAWCIIVLTVPCAPSKNSQEWSQGMKYGPLVFFLTALPWSYPGTVSSKWSCIKNRAISRLLSWCRRPQTFF